MPSHVVVDGSNLATEGRSAPSLKQLNEAVLSYIAEHPTALITVVVDATFGHRIDPREVPEFDAAIANNELVAPPAGAIGRGDAFVLSIAHKVNATILSNDSYQEFHGEYPWLFDEGRLVGGKPVPHVGWVFVNRLPVRGPTSRKSVADSRRRPQGKAADASATVVTGSPEANRPMPVPKAPPPGARIGKAEREPARREPATQPTRAAAPAKATKPSPEPTGQQGGVNDLLTFLTFVERHPPGTSVNAIVESYSSHGAYVTIGAAEGGDVKGYVPLRLMSDPAPRSAREFMKIGESVTLVVEALHAARRSVDLAVPTMATAVAPAPAKAPRAAKSAPQPDGTAAPRRGARKAASTEVEAVGPSEPVAPATKAPAKPAAKKAPAKPAARKAPAKKDAKRAPAEPAARKAPAEPAASKAPAKKPSAEPTAKVAAAAGEPTPAAPPATRTRATRTTVREGAESAAAVAPAAPAPAARRRRATS
jgi:hypothetical protein